MRGGTGRGKENLRGRRLTSLRSWLRRLGEKRGKERGRRSRLGLWWCSTVFLAGGNESFRLGRWCLLMVSCRLDLGFFC
jgi:hypothetical protein